MIDMSGWAIPGLVIHLGPLPPIGVNKAMDTDEKLVCVTPSKGLVSLEIGPLPDGYLILTSEEARTLGKHLIECAAEAPSTEGLVRGDTRRVLVKNGPYENREVFVP